MTTIAKKWIICAAGALALIGAPQAHAEDIMSAIFGAFSGSEAHVSSPRYGLPFASEGPAEPRVSRPAYNVVRGGGQAYCVRTCDGRYFPVSAAEGQSAATVCNNFCPASETKVFHGSTIDNASADNGRQYSALPNAFKYRTELVAGCTCNGKDQIGLAPVKLENDPTLRRGDIVAGADGLMVNRGADRRGASLNLSPAAQSIRSKYERLPVVASE